MFDYLDYKNLIPLDKCLIDLPNYNPLSIKYENFWIQTVKRKVIEGHWVSHEIEGVEKWKWIPGPIFQYVNLWSISMGDAEAGSTPSIGRPRLRDIEWIKGYVHAWALGFSGFKDDEEYTCNRILEDPKFEEKINQKFYKRIKASVYNSKGELKKYMDPLPYLYRYTDKNLGKPYYLQQAKDNVDIECRNIGKSMISGNFAGHNFLTDGVKDYDDWYDNYYSKPEDKRKAYTTDTLISAIASTYSNGLIGKIRVGLDNLPGAREMNGVYYPAPMSKNTMGQWIAGKDIEAKIEINVGGKWVTKGSRSKFIHRSFNDNPLAANSGRYGFGVVDEIGFMNNLLRAHGQIEETMTKDGWKYGCCWMTGTGGDMEGGSTEQVKKMFYSPAAYNCLEFDDTFENTGKKIGMFVPGWMALDEFRDELGNVDKDKALGRLMEERLEKSKATSKEALNSLLQMKPLKPSEAFLVTGSNIFPVADMIDHLNWLEANDTKLPSSKGWIVLDSSGYPKWEEDTEDKIVLQDFPVKKGKYSMNLDGGIQIWEHPDPLAQYGWYVGGIDPYNKSIAPESPSLGSFLLIKRANIGGGEDHDTVVCEYTGRPEDTELFYENIRRILLYYGGKNTAATALHESNFNYIVAEFEKNNSLYLLAKKPTVLTKTNSSNDKEYGFYMGNEHIKEEVEEILKNWLNRKVGVKEDGTSKLQLHYIYSKPLLRELIAWNWDGNFDRVIALMLAVLQAKQMHRILVTDKRDEHVLKDRFFGKQLFLNRSKQQL
jgi:hypothetical protein